MPKSNLVADNDIERALRSVRIFSSLKQNDIAALAAKSRMRIFGPGEVLIDSAWPMAPGLFIIIKGEVLIARKVGQEEMMLAQRGPGEILGELSILDERPPAATVSANGVVEALQLERTVLMSCLKHSPELAQELLRTLASKLREADDARIADHLLDSTGKVAEYILSLLNHDKLGDTGMLKLPTQAELAKRVGISREGVNKALKKLELSTPSALTKLAQQKYQFDRQALMSFTTVSHV